MALQHGRNTIQTIFRIVDSLFLVQFRGPETTEKFYDSQILRLAQDSVFGS